MASEERMHTIKRNSESELKQKPLTPVSKDNAIKIDIVASSIYISLQEIMLINLVPFEI